MAATRFIYWLVTGVVIAYGLLATTNPNAVLILIAGVALLLGGLVSGTRKNGFWLSLVGGGICGIVLMAMSIAALTATNPSDSGGDSVNPHHLDATGIASAVGAEWARLVISAIILLAGLAWPLVARRMRRVKA